MKRTYTTYIAIILLIGNILNQYNAIFPTTFQKWVPIISALLMGIAGIVSSNYNPDGTPAKEPYNPTETGKGSIAPRAF